MQFEAQVIFDKLMVFVAKAATPVMLAIEDIRHWLAKFIVVEARLNCLEAQQVLVAQAESPYLVQVAGAATLAQVAALFVVVAVTVTLWVELNMMSPFPVRANGRQ